MIQVEPPRVFDAFRAAAPPSIDGNLGDWPALPALRLDHTTAETIRRIVPDDHQYTVNADGRVTDGGDAVHPPPITFGVREVSDGWDVEVRLPIYDLQTGPRGWQ